MSAPLRALGRAVPLLFGMVAGYAMRDREEEMKPAVGPITDQLLQDIRKEGHRIVLDESIPDESVNLGSYISNLYRGLYMLGRTRVLLPGHVQESVATKLKHLHHLHRKRRDRHLVAWYETIGVGSEEKLADLLSHCPEANRFDTRYIAYAMSETVDGIKFPTLEQEAVEHFWA
jgi:hypothetical protein